MFLFLECCPKRNANKRISQCVRNLSSMCLELVYSGKSFEGEQRFYSHYSETVKCKMNLGVYLPPITIKENIECPVLYFLNGRTANHENFIKKSGFQRFASKFNICVVCPDTSPRDVDVPIRKDLGPGASYYLDATKEPWAEHYQMFTYVTQELIDLVNRNFPVIKDIKSICGLSMGGFGALICALKRPELYRSISVFAPVCNPMGSDTGRTMFKTYLGEDEEVWKEWDPCTLAENFSGDQMEIIIEQGNCDHFLHEKFLLPDDFIRAAAKNDCLKVIYNEREGYDHSHFFLATFIDEHMKYHAEILNCN